MVICGVVDSGSIPDIQPEYLFALYSEFTLNLFKYYLIIYYYIFFFT